MAKRFTSTEKWDDPWYCSLSEKERLFWVYLLDRCNHAGIWQVNWPLVGFFIKDFVFNPSSFHGRILEISKEKWYIPKFIEFQYGTLNPDNRAHKSVIDILEKEGACKGLISPLEGRKDKDKDKDMVKELVKDKEDDGVKGKKDENKVKSLMGYFYTTYETTFGEKYVANFGKDGTIFKGLLITLSEDRIKELIISFFQSEDEFIKKAGHTIGVFFSQVNKLKNPLTKQDEVLRKAGLLNEPKQRANNYR